MPKRNDVVWRNCTPQSGRGKSGRRPVFIITPKTYNQKSGLAIACPITSRIKGCPFEVIVSTSEFTVGAVLADHVLSIGWKIRKVKLTDQCSAPAFEEVTAKLRTLILEN